VPVELHFCLAVSIQAIVREKLSLFIQGLDGETDGIGTAGTPWLDGVSHGFGLGWKISHYLKFDTPQAVIDFALPEVEDISGMGKFGKQGQANTHTNDNQAV
jgi:hypothetical protein